MLWNNKLTRFSFESNSLDTLQNEQENNFGTCFTFSDLRSIFHTATNQNVFSTQKLSSVYRLTAVLLV